MRRYRYSGLLNGSVSGYRQYIASKFQGGFFLIVGPMSFMASIFHLRCIYNLEFHYLKTVYVVLPVHNWAPNILVSVSILPFCNVQHFRNTTLSGTYLLKQRQCFSACGEVSFSVPGIKVLCVRDILSLSNALKHWFTGLLSMLKKTFK